MPDCPHPSPVGFVAWSAPMATIGGRERQAAEWCRRCGALGVWSEDGDRVEWFLPGALAEMPDCSAQDAPRTPFRGPGAGVVAGADGEPHAPMVAGIKARTGPAAEFGMQINRECVALQDHALRTWAKRAGVSPETLVMAGVVPRPSIEIRGDMCVLTVEARKLPIRERGESEAEFVERVRRMPR